MPIPNFESIMLPLLIFAKDKTAHSVNDAEKYLSRHFGLSKEERGKLKPSGRETTFLNRLRWARTFLNRAGLLRDPQIAHFEITPRGIKVLEQNPPKIDTKFLRQFSEFVEWEKKSKIQSVIKIDQNPKKKIPEKYGVVILLDALGTKGIWKDNDTDLILDRWKTFIGFFEHMFNSRIEDFKLKATFTAFSDTTIMTVTGRNIENLLPEIATSLTEPFIMGLVSGIYLRGCITLGKFYQTEGIVIGSAIDEAAQYYSVPNWIGISASPSTHMALEKIKDTSSPYFQNSFCKYDIPLKNSIERNGWVLNWAGVPDEYIQEISTVFELDIPFSSVKDIITKQLSSNLTNLDNALKWRNTLDFYQEIMERMYSK